jgi:uncharacterized spore protein YtfJ
MQEKSVATSGGEDMTAAYGALERALSAFDRVGQAAATVGPPYQVGERAVIPLAEVWYGGGFGLGGGSGQGSGRREPGEKAASQGMGSGGGLGGGGGFGGRARPVAVVELGPAGARVRPIFDVTAIGLVLVTAGLAALAQVWRQRGQGR